MLEFVVAMIAVVAAVTGAVLVLRTEWNRARCSWQAFEKTRKALSSEAAGGGYPGVVEDAESFTGTSVCGGAIERVSMAKLEAGRWRGKDR